MESVDCIVKVDTCKAFGRGFTDSYIDWNLPEHQKRALKILKLHGGKMHYADFLKAWSDLPWHIR
jgi:hypothetical protein